MKRFQKIAVVIDLDDASDDALWRGVHLAQENQGSLDILCCVPQPLHADQQQTIDRILSERITMPYELFFLEGKPLVALCQHCADHGTDVLIIEPAASHGFQDFFFGALPASLMRKAPCPVWVEKPNKNHSYQRILVAIDPSNEDAVKAGLNNKLIEIGTALAQRENAECHLVTAWHLAGESTLRGGFLRTPEHEVEGLKTHAKIEHTRAFEAVQQRHIDSLRATTTHLIEGNPNHVIPQFIDQHDIDIVVMGTIARSGIEGFVIGNTAEAVIHQVHCALIAIKPDGFISPAVK